MLSCSFVFYWDFPLKAKASYKASPHPPPSDAPTKTCEAHGKGEIRKGLHVSGVIVQSLRHPGPTSPGHPVLEVKALPERTDTWHDKS